ncbi:uncharacterized protein [Venturia canescens]|uniref:uncharacterized protein n=1 Tax=Venturia canescens TaxID=32260 RepID=UPI001C9BFD51|nr:uncharacterized protein LOC122408176 [Venturia canescens]
MTRFTSVSFFVTVLVLVNFVLISSAVRTFDLGKVRKNSIVFNENDVVTPEQEIFTKRFLSPYRANRYIGDLIIGEDQEGQTVYVDAIELTNPSDQDVSGTLTFTIPSGIINLVAVLNQPESTVVICDTPETLGSSTSVVNVRVVANSVSKLLVIIAAH